MKNKSKKESTYLYALQRGGKTKYYGITNNPSRRKSEHKESGKKFTKMKIINKFPSRRAAEVVEGRTIRKYQRIHGGKPPRYNKAKTYKK